MAEFNQEEAKEMLKNSAEKVKDSAVKITQTVIGKTENLVGKAKIKYALSETEKKLNEVYAEIGKYVYEKYKDMDLSENGISDKFALASSFKAEISALNERLKEFGD